MGLLQVNTKHIPIKRQNWRVVWILVISAAVLYAVMLLWTVPYLQQLAGGVPLPDMRPLGYTAAELYEVLQLLGAHGRHFYLTVQLVLDFFYPLCFGLGFFVWLRRLAFRRRETVVAIVPLLTMVADWLENAATVWALVKFPQPTPMISYLGSVASVTKSMLLITTVVVVSVQLWRYTAQTTEKRNKRN